MRGALLALLAIAAGTLVVSASAADSSTPAHAHAAVAAGSAAPARARARASVVAGSLGAFGTLTARGDTDRTDDGITVQDHGIVVGEADAIARASRAGGRGTARAVTLARRVDLFDGL